MAEYNDPTGRVIVRAELALNQQLEDAIKRDGPALILTLDDGTLVLGDLLNEGTGDTDLIEAASMVVQEAVPIPDQQSAYVTKSNLQRLRNVLRKVAR